MPAAGPPDRSGPLRVGIVPHTHWDREWYVPFQTFRVRLVNLLDELLPLLESDLGYARFLLDGQTQVVDDYLDVRPEAQDRIRRLVGSGRLSIGPWMIQMDEFMVSGETIVRDLQMGQRRAAALGGAMPVGYLPDLFGHVAQMPQLLAQAGIKHAVVWRGVPSAIDRTAFWWEAPDGSRVRAEYLWGSYSNARDLPDDAKQLVGRAKGFEQELGAARLPDGGMLLMNGTDHQMPQPWLGRLAEEANGIQSDYEFVVTSLPEYLADQPVDELVTWRGELRSGARANVLMGVASNRVDVHQAAAAAERALERRAEPLSAVLLPPDRYPAALLERAWQQVVLNSAHDSSCACSHDEVVQAVLVRYQEARQIGDALVRDALHGIAAAVDAPPLATVVANPTPATRGGIASVFLPGDGPRHLVALDDGTPCPVQVVREISGEGFTATVSGSEAGWILDMIRGPEFAGSRIGRVEREDRPDGVVAFTFHGVDRRAPAMDLEAVREELADLVASGTTLHLRTRLAPLHEVIVSTPGVPGLGWRTFVKADGEGPATGVRAAGAELANEHLVVTVDADDGTYEIRTGDGLALAGLGRLVEQGDGGDTYNFSPPDDDEVIDAPDRVEVAVVEQGPVRARTEIRATYHWPAHAIGDEWRCTARSPERVATTVVTTLEVHTGEPFLRVRHELDHHVRDHRLRAHFPLPSAVDHSAAECAFAVVERGLTTEGGPHELALPTFVSRRFVDCAGPAGGVALVHDGLLEYEVVDGGRELALTLLRSTGYLSRAGISMRPNPAGPLDPLEGPQLQGRHAVEYAVVVHRGDWAAAALHEVADEVLVPLERTFGGGGASPTVPPTGQPLRVEGLPVTSVQRDGTALVVRAHNPHGEPRELSVDRDGGPATGWVVDLRDRPLERFEGRLLVPAGRIVTLRLP